MKRSKYFRALGFLATLIVALLVVSPNNCIAATKSSNKATENVSQDYAWQRLLSSCMKKPMYGGNLKLLGYNQAGKADTAEKRQRYLDKCFSPNSYMLFSIAKRARPMLLLNENWQPATILTSNTFCRIAHTSQRR